MPFLSFSHPCWLFHSFLPNRGSRSPAERRLWWSRRNGPCSGTYLTSQLAERQAGTSLPLLMLTPLVLFHWASEARGENDTMEVMPENQKCVCATLRPACRSPQVSREPDTSPPCSTASSAYHRNVPAFFPQIPSLFPSPDFHQDAGRL